MSWCSCLPNQSELMVFNFADCCAVKGKQIISFSISVFPMRSLLRNIVFIPLATMAAAVGEEHHDKA